MKLRLTFAAALILLALGVGLIWYRTHPTTAASGSAPSSSSGNEALPEEYDYVPAPHISLRINGSHEPTIHPGTPLLFSLRVANQRAINAALLNRAHKVRLASLQEKMTQGKVQKEDADALSARLQREIPIKPVTLGRDNAAWQNSVRFVRRMADGNDVPLPWNLQKITPDGEKSLLLDANTTGEIDFGLGPAVAANLAPAEYVIVAILDVAGDASLPDSSWRGRVEAEPVTLKVTPSPGKVSPSESVATELDYVAFFLATHQGAPALVHAQKAVAASPTNIDANIAVGDSKTMLGDNAGALDAYETARKEFTKQQADAYERPTLLLSKISGLRAKPETKP